MLLTVRLIHITFAVTWFAIGLFPAGDMRRAFADGRPQAKYTAKRLLRQGKFIGISALLTIITGVWLIFLMGGFAAAPKAIHMSLGLAIVFFIFGAVAIRGTMVKIAAALEGDTDDAGITKSIKRLSMFTGIGHLFWLTLMVLMVFRNSI